MSHEHHSKCTDIISLVCPDLNVSIDVTYNPPNDSIWLDQNEYRAASGPLNATCRVQGTSGVINFQWSSTCRDCPFQSTKPESTSNVLHRPALHSGDTGTHTCTVNDNQGSAGTASIVMNVKGKIVLFGCDQMKIGLLTVSC